MHKGLFFPYSWHLDDKETENTLIRVYGLDDKNKNVCLHIKDFYPYVYLELPEYAQPGNTKITWTTGKTQLVSNKLSELLGSKKPLRVTSTRKKKLYGAYLDENGQRKSFYYLCCEFSSKGDIRMLGFKLRNHILVAGLGSIRLKMHESDADPILQLTCSKDIPTAGWIIFAGNCLPSDEKITLCDYEYNVSSKNVKSYKADHVPKPKIMGFDIEVNSTNPTAMPKACNPGDKVFQISCVLSRDGDGPDYYEKYLLTLGEPDEETVGLDTIVTMYNSESALLEGFTEFIREENPNLIVGYNILGFDIPYMIDRAKFNYVFDDFDKQGFHCTAHAKERTIRWSSSAYKNQEFQFLDAEGRIYVDLLPLIRRDFKFNNYKLKTIAEYFVGQTKDPLSPKGIFKCYEIGMKKNSEGKYTKKARKAMGIVGKYAVQDSALVVMLMDKLKTWVGLTEMAKTCNVPIFSLYTQGQQIKVFSQLYKYCYTENIVVEKDAYQVTENERYVGAKVFDPKPGKYKKVVPFDFASLYPTTIIAYNIDYHTWVPPNSDIPDCMCNVMEWEDHLGCEHDPKVIRKLELTKYITEKQAEIKKMRERRNKILDKLAKKEAMDDINKSLEALKPYTNERAEISKTIAKVPMCAKRRYKFIKEPKGVLPTIIQNLLDARKHTRKVVMKQCYKEIDKIKAEKPDNSEDLIQVQKSLIDVLDKRQLSYKVSANSMYGAMGVRKGYLPFMPGAMCTTYMGRVNIELVAETIPRDYGGELVYGDTDCVSPYTPVLILKDEKIYYKTVDELSDGNWSRINPNKEISKCKEGYKIWSDQGFTDIVNVVRCGIKKPISRVLTHVGVVSCSNEHSLLRDTLESVTPEDLKQKDKLCISELPLPEDTPEEPVYPNNLTAEKIREYVISDEIYEDLPAPLAFVWGVFFADGSCGSYKSGGSIKHSWAISKKDNLLLKRCGNILFEYESQLGFKILDTLKSSNANKLVPCINLNIEEEFRGTIKAFVEKYRALFYDDRKYKKVPDIVLNAPYFIREAFFMGYYAGDGSKKDPALCLTNKGEIGSAGLFFLLRSIGYQVSINTRADKPDTYKLTGSTPKQKLRYAPNAVKKIEPYKIDEDEYIYDIQTENHHFAAGVGQLVVHNSNYIHFPHILSAQETWDYALHVAKQVSSLFPKPIELEFEEEIYNFFFILSKKRYMYRKCLRDGVEDKKIGKKGVLLARRDNSKFVRDLYEAVISKIADSVRRDDILLFILDQMNELCSGVKPISDFVITKAVGDSGGLVADAFIDEKGIQKAKVGDYTVPFLSTDKDIREDQLLKKGVDISCSCARGGVCSACSEFYLLCLPAQVQLAERMKRRGQLVPAGTRLEYVVADPDNHTGKQYEKVESAEYLSKHSDLVKIDFMYYLKALVNPLDQVLDVAYGNDVDYKIGFVMDQYKFRWKTRAKFLEQIRSIYRPKITFLEE